MPPCVVVSAIVVGLVLCVNVQIDKREHGLLTMSEFWKRNTIQK